MKFIIIVCLLFLGGCVTEEVQDDPKINMHPTAKDRGIKIKPKKSGPELCFERFRNACAQEKWMLAYQELSSGWQSHSSLSHFAKNMEAYGANHLKEARIVSITNVKTPVGKKCTIVAQNFEENKTVYVFVEEKKGLWKLDGVKNLKE